VTYGRAEATGERVLRAASDKLTCSTRRRTRPKRVTGKYWAAWKISEKDSASVRGTENRARAKTVAAWITPTKPGLDGRLTPRPMNARTAHEAASGRSRCVACSAVHTARESTSQIPTEAAAMGS